MIKTAVVLGTMMGLALLAQDKRLYQYNFASDYSSGFNMYEIEKARKRNQKRKRRK